MNRGDSSAVRGGLSNGMAAAIGEIEGYLLAQSERANARVEAQDFAARMPWLTTAQHDEIVRHYTEARVTLARRQLEAVAARCVGLREEYEQRYRELRSKLLCRHLATALTATALLGAAMTLLSTTRG